LLLWKETSYEILCDEERKCEQWRKYTIMFRLRFFTKVKQQCLDNSILNFCLMMQSKITQHWKKNIKNSDEFFYKRVQLEKLHNFIDQKYYENVLYLRLQKMMYWFTESWWTMNFEWHYINFNCQKFSVSSSSNLINLQSINSLCAEDLKN
jgi:hypothetical protein